MRPRAVSRQLNSLIERNLLTLGIWGRCRNRTECWANCGLLRFIRRHWRHEATYVNARPTICLDHASPDAVRSFESERTHSELETIALRLSRVSAPYAARAPTPSTPWELIYALERAQAMATPVNARRIVWPSLAQRSHYNAETSRIAERPHHMSKGRHILRHYGQYCQTPPPWIPVVLSDYYAIVINEKTATRWRQNCASAA